jgi:hypothetical protein
MPSRFVPGCLDRLLPIHGGRVVIERSFPFALLLSDDNRWLGYVSCLDVMPLQYGWVHLSLMGWIGVTGTPALTALVCDMTWPAWPSL